MAFANHAPHNKKTISILGTENTEIQKSDESTLRIADIVSDQQQLRIWLTKHDTINGKSPRYSDANQSILLERNEPKIRGKGDILLSIKSRRENFLKRPTTTKMNKQTQPTQKPCQISEYLQIYWHVRIPEIDGIWSYGLLLL